MGLHYVLKEVRQRNKGGAPRTDLGSLVYRNNPLRDCEVKSVQVRVNMNSRSAVQKAMGQIGASLGASTKCSIDTTSGTASLELTTTYERITEDPSHDGGVLRFPGRNSTDRASLCFGEFLLAMCWHQFVNAYNQERKASKFDSIDSFIYFEQPERRAPGNGGDIKSLDFFQTEGVFRPSNSTSAILDHLGPSAQPTTGSISSSAQGPSNSSNPLPGIWIPADSLAKSLYSTILTDLGQDNTSLPNVFIDQSLLEHFTKISRPSRSSKTSKPCTTGSSSIACLLSTLTSPPGILQHIA